MNAKELFTILGLALLSTWTLQYFWGGKRVPDQQDQVQSGQRLAAIKLENEELRQPLNTEVDFWDVKSTYPTDTTIIDTEHARYQFSSNGAALQHVEFKRNWGGKVGYLSTVLPGSSVDKETRCFLVAFDSQTPYYFKLIKHTQEDGEHRLTYSASFGQGTITKEFVVHTDTYKIDVHLLIEPHEGQVVRPRIFFPSPLVPELLNEDAVQALVNDMHNSVRTYPKNEETLESFWVRPTLFGTEDRYFTHALIADHDQFVQRGYFAARDLHSLYSIVEGPRITVPTQWHLSFYFGPKSATDMALVDPRLEQTLNYGRLGFVSKPLSKLLLRILNYLYGLVHNYGVAIIVLTLLMKLLLLPFTWRAEQGMAHLKNQEDMQKKLQYIQQKYKNDPQRLAHERAELVKKFGMPKMLAGCLPLLLFQIPMFIALNWVLSYSIELYKAPFLWISDLSARDPYFILPVIAGLAMLLQTASAPKKDISPYASSAGLALLIGAMTAYMAAGLALFIVVSTLLAVLQSRILKVVRP